MLSPIEQERMTTIAIVIARVVTLKTDKFRESNEEKKQRTSTKIEARKIRSDNFTRSNGEKSNTAITVLE